MHVPLIMKNNIFHSWSVTNTLQLQTECVNSKMHILYIIYVGEQESEDTPFWQLKQVLIVLYIPSGTGVVTDFLSTSLHYFVRDLFVLQYAPKPSVDAAIVFLNYDSVLANGQWNPWGPWSGCSKSCDGGWQRRARVCQGAAVTGQQCDGTGEEVRKCSDQRCPGKPKDNRTSVQIKAGR